MTTIFTYSDELYRDLYRDAFGCRPSASAQGYWNNLCPVEKQKEWDFLVSMAEESAERERREAFARVEDFKSLIRTCLRHGAANETVALRWLTADENFVHEQEIEYWVWNHGILFTDYGKNLLENLKYLHNV